MRSELKTYTNNPNFKPESPFLALTPEEQAVDARPGMIQLLDGRPMFCIDILPINTERAEFLLPIRLTKPAEGPWFIGGGLKRNHDITEGVSATFLRETGLHIATDRFTPLALSRFVWDYRQEEPQSNGRVDINLCFSIELTPDELATIQLTSAEYDANLGLTPYSLQDLIKLADQNPAKQVFVDYHRYLFDR